MRTALCVEDDNDTIQLMKLILKSIGFELLVAHEGHEALKLAAEYNPDFILIDYHLPGMDGVETTKLLKNDPSQTHIPIIAFTADTYSQTMFIEAGCDIFLTKPIHRAALIQAIQQVLGSTCA